MPKFDGSEKKVIMHAASPESASPFMNTKTVLFAAAYAAVVSPLCAQSFNIDFSTEYNSGHGSVSSTYGAAANQAGVWNEITSDGPTALVDLSGAASGASYQSGVGLSYNCTIAPGTSTDEICLLGDGMMAMNGTWRFSITGLSNADYTIYYYEPAHSSVSTGAFTVNGIAATPLSSTSTTLTQNVNWASMQVTVTDGTLSFVGSSVQDTTFYGLAGLQIVGPVPEPSTYAFFGGAAALGLVLIRRRRK
jgi:hypothetical protein